MEIVWKIVYSFLIAGLELFIFFKVDGIVLTLERFFKAFLFKLLLAVVLVTINYIVGNTYLSYFVVPLYGIGLSFLLLRGLPKKLLFFYGLFPMILVNLFYRGVSYFVLPFLDQGQINDNYSFIWVFIMIFNFFISLAFLKWLDYDFTSLRKEILDKAFQKSLTKINWIMGAYFLVMENLSYFEYAYDIQSKTVRHLILVFYLLFFMGIIKKLDTYLKDKLHEKLNQEQALRYRDMERYSRHIEELYKEVRSFRHDYTNLLTSLRLGIEGGYGADKEVYDSVLKDSSQKLQDNKYDLGRLVNIRDKALKSLLAGKFLKARDKKIVFNVEIPEEIQVEGMSLLDFLTIVSILCDNAIEASVEACQPHVSIAFLKNGAQETFIIENSIKEEGIDISEIFSFGASSKGEERGVGLYTVMKIVESHPNISLNTTCQNQVFRQVLTVHLL